MKQPITPTESLFIDEQNDVIDPLPIFVTRTTLRSILQAHRAKTLLELDTRSTASIRNEPMPSETPIFE